MVSSWWLLLVFSVLAYLAGSISSSVVVCRLAGLPDPRTHGSNNPGATNVLRVAGKKAAIATLLGDVLKGFLPVFIALRINPFPEFVGPVMLFVFLGHLYPIFLRFKGGKGVATAVGAILALNWLLGILLIATWLFIVFLFRWSSLGALVAALTAPFYTMWLLGIKFAIPIFIISAFIFWRHRSNIKRLIEGSEPKVGKR